jgi:hypothetical protein
MSSVEIARAFNAEGVKTPSQIHAEKGLRHFKPKGDVYLWQHTSILRMLKNRDYIGDLVQGTTTCTKIRGGKKLTEKEDLIITEKHHEAIIDRELFDKVQARFSGGKKNWKKTDKHVLVGRVKCGCCRRNLRHVGKNQGQPYYWCSGVNVNNLESCVERIDDFFLEEIILYQLQQHVLELGESDRLLQEEKDRTLAEVEALQKECQQAEKAIADAKQKRMEAFEDYALGKSKSYDGSVNRLDELRKSYEEVKVKLSEAEVKAAEYDRRKVHESFAVLKLTPELLDEYVESIEVHSGDDVRIVWK